MKNIFLIRSTIDLEYNLPLINSLDNSEIWLRNKLDIQQYFYLFEKEIKIKYLLSNNFIFNIFFKDKVLFKNLKYLLETLNSEVNIFIDHDWNSQLYAIISLIRKFTYKSNIILIPHGVNLFQNRMLDYHIIDNEKFDISNIDYDVFISNDIHFLDLYNLNLSSKNLYFPSWRYTFNEVHKRYLSKYGSECNNKGLNILLYHSKRGGNIYWQNLIRTIKIINKHTNYNIYIKPHPRGGLKEASNLLFDRKRNLILDKNFNFGSNNNFDFYFVLSSSVVIDLLILDKHVVILNFVCGNTFRSDILDKCTVLNSPEELISWCYNSNFFKPYVNNFEFGVDFDRDNFLQLISSVK